LLTVLRQQKILKQMNGLNALSGAQASALEKTVATLFASIQKKK